MMPSLVVLGGMLLLLDSWAALLPPHRFEFLPEWFRLVGPAVFVRLALAQPRGQRAALVVIGAMFFVLLNREWFGYSPWLHPVM